MLEKEAIEKVQSEPGEFVSGYFANYKKNHTPQKPKIRAILNLKPMNKYVHNVKLRMETLNDHYMVSIDVGRDIGIFITH